MAAPCLTARLPIAPEPLCPVPQIVCCGALLSIVRFVSECSLLAVLGNANRIADQVRTISDVS